MILLGPFVYRSTSREHGVLGRWGFLKSNVLLSFLYDRLEQYSSVKQKNIKVNREA